MRRSRRVSQIPSKSKSRAWRGCVEKCGIVFEAFEELVGAFGLSHSRNLGIVPGWLGTYCKDGIVFSRSVCWICRICFGNSGFSAKSRPAPEISHCQRKPCLLRSFCIAGQFFRVGQCADLVRPFIDVLENPRALAGVADHWYLYGGGHRLCKKRCRVASRDRLSGRHAGDVFHARYSDATSFAVQHTHVAGQQHH